MPKILKSSDDVAPYVDIVRTSADRHRDELGFLRAGVYAEQAAQGHLWVAVEIGSDRLVGFLLYGGRFPHLRIFQLFVRKDARSMGIGSSLVDELVKFGEENNFLTASAKVAAELPANSFWEREGFRIVDQVRGGTSKGRLINVRLRELDSPALFKIGSTQNLKITGIHSIRFSDAPTLSNRTYVLDLNVFFDLIRRRINRNSAQRIIAAALANEIRVLVTPEFSRELERHTSIGGVDPVLEFSRTLPTLPSVDQAQLEPLVRELEGMIFPSIQKTGKRVPNDASDLLHLAYCIHHKAWGFLTSEKAILRCGDKLRQTFGIEILAPSDLIDSISESPQSVQRQSTTVTLGSRYLSLASLAEHDRAEAEKYLTRRGLQALEIGTVLDPGTSVLSRPRVIAKADGALVGLASWSQKSSEVPELIAHVHVDENSPVFERVLDHFIESIQREGRYSELKRIVLFSRSGSLKTHETLAARGFRGTRHIDVSSNECFIKPSLKGPLSKTNWTEIKDAFFTLSGYRLPAELPSYRELHNSGLVLKAPSTTLPVVAPLFDFETMISPGFVLAPGREAVLVPIRETYAGGLIGLNPAQLSFLPSPEAFLRLEKAYFMAPGRHQLFVKGTLIIFYVSGANRGRKEAIGVARTTFADTIAVEQAKISLARQGVLPENDLRERAGKSGKLTAFTFDNFLAFPNPVPYSTLKDLNCIGAANLVTAEKLSFQKVEKILSKAFSKSIR
jgi:GNAT superfamily N-acetyltransferase/predicted nucleic acid-binding protein